MCKTDYKSPEEALKEYEAFKRLTIKTDKIKDIIYYMKNFLAHINKPLDKLQEKDIISFLNAVNKKYSIGTQNTIKATLKNFIKWNYPSWSSDFRNLSTLCKSMKAQRPYDPEDMLSIEDIEKLVKTEESVYWKAFIMVLFYGGCRPIEIMRMKWKDISFEKDGAYITIYSKKNNKSFQKYVPDNVVFYLKKLENNGSDLVFPSPENKERTMHKKTFALRMRKLSPKALGRKVNPYLLRHSVATILYNRDDLKDEYVAKQLGHHKSMRSTYDNLHKDKLRAKMRRMWIEGEELPEEKKHKLETRIEELEKQNAMFNDFYIRTKDIMEKAEAKEKQDKNELKEWGLKQLAKIDKKEINEWAKKQLARVNTNSQ